ncbi:hypothetical protein D3C72_1861340 [compost metagenome]
MPATIDQCRLVVYFRPDKAVIYAFCISCIGKFPQGNQWVIRWIYIVIITVYIEDQGKAIHISRHTQTCTEYCTGRWIGNIPERQTICRIYTRCNRKFKVK